MLGFFKIVFSKSLDTHTNGDKNLQGSIKKVSLHAETPSRLSLEPGIVKEHFSFSTQIRG